VNKFDRYDPTGWVTQMEHYFSLDDITDDIPKPHYGFLYLDLERWKWWKWHRKTRHGYVAWTQFVAELYDRFDTNTHYLGRLTKLKQSDTLEDFIYSFEHLDFRTEGMYDAFFWECFMSGLKKEIRAQILMVLPQIGLEATQCAKESQKIVSSQTHKPSFFPRTQPTNPTPPLTPLKIHKLTWAEMEECQLKGLCYNSYEKKILGKKCKEKSILWPSLRMFLKKSSKPPLVVELPEPIDITLPFEKPKVESVISLNDLTGFYSPQTLKLIGYIKDQNFIILSDSGINHNFIQRHISQETHCYILAFDKFQIMISNGASMKCGGSCENVCLQIG
jgi:hypothetical protein